MPNEQYLYQEIAESLRRRIAAGEFKPGDKLPTMRQMARQWNCTPGTVSRAYAQLTREGLIEGQRGAGTRVTAAPMRLEHAAWQWASLVNRAEQFLLEAIGSGHTPAQAETALSVAIGRWREWQRTESPDQAAAPGQIIRFAGSHDLAVERLARLLREEMPEAELSREYLGSLGGIMALTRGEADIAGSHLWDEATNSYNVPFLQRLLPGQRIALLTLVHRSLGFMVPPGNPQQLQTISDLAHPEVRLVNRQAGSGTRVWLDAQLKAVGVDPASIAGHDNEKLTHLGVAETVRRGEATVGLGIHAAAAADGLDFIPLTQERYDLVIPKAAWSTPAVQALTTVIRSARFQEAVMALGGYDTGQTGHEQWLGV